MTLRNTLDMYGSVTKLFHWVIAFVVILMLIMGSLMDFVPKSESFLRANVYTFHKSLGLLLLMLIVLRLLWRLVNPKLHLLNGLLLWEKILAKINHWLLYFFVIGMTLSGWVMSTAGDKVPKFFWLISIPAPFVPVDKTLAHDAAEIHETFAWILATLILIHITAALYHHFIKKDSILKRMWIIRKT